MAPNGSSTTVVKKATAEDLRFISEWLKHKHAGDGEGFYDNFKHVCSTLKGRDDVWVICRNEQAIAFQAPGIMCVRKDLQHGGYGASLVDAWVERVAVDIKRNVISVQCTPEESLGFWTRMGFEHYIDPRQIDYVLARRIIQRTFDLPTDGPRVDVVISFYPQRASYSEPEAVNWIGSHRVSGVRQPDGIVRLERRIIGLEADEDEGKDLVVKIHIDGEEICFCKANYDKAQEAGMRHNPLDGSFYVDQIHPIK